jgi:membrane-bound ClpP family serine protease
MKLTPPKQSTFWAAVIIAAVGVVLEIVHLVSQQIPFLGGAAIALVVVGFVLLCLGLTLKGF